MFKATLILFTVFVLFSNPLAVQAQQVNATGGKTADGGGKAVTEAAKKEKEAAKKEKEAAKKKLEEAEEVVIEVDPHHKNGVFDEGNTVDYKVKLKSTYKTPQEGKLTYDVLTDDNKNILSNSLPVKLSRGNEENYHIVIPQQKAGFYRFNVRINLTDNDDTVKRVFGISPEKITSELHRPADFDDFWKATLDELKLVPPQYKITPRSDLSNKDKKVYEVEMHSYGNVIIRGWMVIPTFGHRFPVHYRVPGYGVPMHPNMDADDFIAFDLDVRGNGISQDNIKLNTDIYSTTGLEDRDRYIYRGAYMDCIRGMDFLYTQHAMGVDTAKIYVEGGSQGGCLGIVTAALDKRVKVLTIQVPLYSDIRDTHEIQSTYTEQVFPFKMFNKYKETHPGYTWDEFYKVFDYYDPQNFAPLVKCPVLMGIGLLDLYCPPRSSMAMFNHLATDKKEYVTVANTTHEVNFNYFMFQNNWLREQLRIP